MPKGVFIKWKETRIIPHHCLPATAGDNMPPTQQNAFAGNDMPTTPQDILLNGGPICYIPSQGAKGLGKVLKF